MNNTFAIIDVETPNSRHDAICSLGLVLVQKGIITNKNYYLINPETDFDDRCISVHGITSEDVKNAPIFPEVWKNIEKVISGYLLVGHNLGFDLSCIRKALNKYHIDSVPAHYIDTLTLSRNYVFGVENYRLPTMCRYFDIVLDAHHNALCDSIATAKLLLRLLNRYDIDIDGFIKQYFFDDYTYERDQIEYNETTKALQELQGVLYGVISDGELNNQEIYAIERWGADHYELKGNYPYDRIYDTVFDILADGVITEAERAELFSLINNSLNPVKSSHIQLEVCMDGAVVCLSGEFDCMSKSDFAKLLVDRGAIVKNNVVKSLNYLIVGDRGSELWAHGNYGTKVKKAMEFNEKGGKIEILRESDILSSVLDE